MRKHLFLWVISWFVTTSIVWSQTNEYSLVHFYYTNSFGQRPAFKVFFNDKEAFQLEKKARIQYKLYSTGDLKISCFYGIENNVKKGESSVTLNIQHGKTYYVKLYNTYLKLVNVDEVAGKEEFNNSNLSAIQNFVEDIHEPFINTEKSVNYASVKDAPTSKEETKSDVDVDIPVTKLSKPNAYALIIGNEDYSSFQTGLSAEVNVDFAINDAKVFKEYCVRMMGIPERQVKLLLNGTAGQMNQAIAWLNNLAKIDDGKAELIFYYSGHGLPDEQTRESYLMPVDISGNNIPFAIKLSDLYSKLNEYPVKRVSIFLDACFSGGARNQGLISMKGFKVKPKENQIQKSMFVLSSSTGDESSGVYREKQHGYMTYYLLKKLQETKGEATYKELTDFVIETVKKETALNGKIQTPQCKYSPDVENIWTNWTLNK